MVGEDDMAKVHFELAAPDRQPPQLGDQDTWSNVNG